MIEANFTLGPFVLAYIVLFSSIVYFFAKNAKSFGLFSRIKKLPSFSFFLFLSMFILIIPSWENDRKLAVFAAILISIYLSSFVFVGLTPPGKDFDNSADDLMDASAVVIFMIVVAFALSFFDMDKFPDKLSEVISSLFIGQSIIKSISAVLKSSPRWSSFPIKSSTIDLLSKIWILTLIYCFSFPSLFIVYALIK
ncbi:hypothetical protein [Corynebacterium mastitidis]|uniref:hypothetical protein n=1 Tax=Corynebacterium mastitidis TaxID=161890 RepID=UPI00254DC159|nr:hypothetical protein [Corynebacterium mastitidis]MDK8450740.1 hypothetical protein [Corynebacterium mastitidis]